MFAPGQQLSVTGVRSVPVICVEFKNVAAPFPAAQYQTLLFGTEPTTMSAYYRDVSQGKLTVTGQVVGWYKAAENDTFYENAANGEGLPFGQLLTFALTKADEELDFGQFDNDGPDGVANSGDDDGKVDTVFFIHPEKGAECDNGTNIWSHSWHYSEPTYGHSGPFKSNDIRRDINGLPLLLANGQPAHIVVDDYTIQPGLSCAATAAAPQIIEIGVICHEYGHALGLPDLYDRTPQSGADSEGVGNWCLMGGGSYGGDGEHPNRPARMSGWCKYYLGWATPQVVAADEDMELDAVSVRNDMLRCIVPGTNGLEYFLIEHRRSGPGAGGAVNWDEHLFSTGLAIWHIDERVGAQSADWPFAPANQGQNDSPVRVNATVPPLFKSKRPLVALVQADKLMELEGNGNRGNAGDLFTAGTFGDDPTGKAGTRGYDGNATNIAVEQIQITANTANGKIKIASGSGPNPSPRIAAAPPRAPKLKVSPEARDRLGSVKSKLDAGRKPGRSLPPITPEAARKVLSPNEVKVIEQADPAVIREVLPPAAASRVLQLGADLRTRTIRRGDGVQTPVDQAAKKLLTKSGDAQSVDVGYAPGGKRIAQISGLKIPSTQTSPRADAQNRIANDPDLKEALALPASGLAPVTTDASSRVQEFRQTSRVGSAELPVFDTNVTMRYDDNDQLVAVTSNTLPSLQPVRDDPATTAQQARQVVTNTLGIPDSRITSVTKGIHVPKDARAMGDPSGRVAFRVTVQITEGQKPLEAFVDASTQKLLEVK
jgi:M6 family metalloprotease-like protein